MSLKGWVISAFVGLREEHFLDSCFAQRPGRPVGHVTNLGPNRCSFRCATLTIAASANQSVGLISLRQVCGVLWHLMKGVLNRCQTLCRRLFMCRLISLRNLNIGPGEPISPRCVQVFSKPLEVFQPLTLCNAFALISPLSVYQPSDVCRDSP